MVHNYFWKNPIFDPFWSHFWSQVAPFQDILEFSIRHDASPGAQNWLKTLVSASQVVPGHFWKNAFLTHF